MKKNMIAAAAVAALALPAAAFAADGDSTFSDKKLSYTFAEFGFVDKTLDAPGDPSADGFGFGVSYEFTDMLFGFLSHEDLSGDGDVTIMNFGVGAAVGLTDSIDGYAKFGMVDVEVAGFDDDGFGLEFGARSMINEQVELFGNFQYIDLTDSDSGIEFGGRYWFQENLGVGLSYESIGDFDGFNIMARYEF